MSQDINQLELGQQLGELTQAIRDLTGRIGSLEKDMKLFQLFFAGGKGAMLALLLAGALMVNGASALLSKVWEMLK